MNIRSLHFFGFDSRGRELHVAQAALDLEQRFWAKLVNCEKSLFPLANLAGVGNSEDKRLSV